MTAEVGRQLRLLKDQLCLAMDPTTTAGPAQDERDSGGDFTCLTFRKDMQYRETLPPPR